MVNSAPILSGVTSLPWFHPVNVCVAHQQALELMVEVLETAVDEALPEARRRHPLPQAVPGALLGTLVRDGALAIALSAAFEGQTLRAAAAPNLGLHLVTRDSLLRVRIRKMPDPEQRVPAQEQLELELFPDGYADVSIFGAMPELALFWAVKGEALYRVVLAAPEGWDDEASLSTWYGAVELHAPAVRTLVWPDPAAANSIRADGATVADDLDDLIVPQRPEEGQEAPGDAS
jgi:hypothetical protein